jgi:hypothetical protein
LAAASRPREAYLLSIIFSLFTNRAVVAAGDYVRAKTPLRSVFSLTSIAPTPFDVHASTSEIHRNNVCRSRVDDGRQPNIYYLFTIIYSLFPYLCAKENQLI